MKWNLYLCFSFHILGKPRIITWTRLAKTAEPGTNKLILEHPVDWQPGEHIIITSTGGKSSHNESEEHIIQGNLMNYAINLDYQWLLLSVKFTIQLFSNFFIEFFII